MRARESLGGRRAAGRGSLTSKEYATTTIASRRPGCRRSLPRRRRTHGPAESSRGSSRSTDDTRCLRCSRPAILGRRAPERPQGLGRQSNLRARGSGSERGWRATTAGRRPRRSDDAPPSGRRLAEFARDETDDRTRSEQTDATCTILRVGNGERLRERQAAAGERGWTRLAAIAGLKNTLTKRQRVGEDQRDMASCRRTGRRGRRSR